MSFEAPWTRLKFLPPGVWEYLLALLYAFTTLGFLFYARRDFLRLNWRRLLLFFGLMVTVQLAAFRTLDFPSPHLLPPGVPREPPPPFVSLLALPVVAAGAWLGAGPALLVGLVGGILRAGMTTGGVTDPFHFALFGFLVGYFLRQDYRGRLPLVLRQPVIASPLAMLFATPLLLLSLFAHVVDSGLAGLDYAVALTTAHFGPALLESLVAAIIVQPLYILVPRLRPVRAAYHSPPYIRTLNRRLLFLFVPLILIMTVVLLYAVTKTTFREATLSVVGEMARDAESAAGVIPSLITTGHTLMMNFAADEELQYSSDPLVLEDRLLNDVRTMTFFRQLTLFDSSGQPLALYPPEPTGDPALTMQEARLLERVRESGAPQMSTVHRSRRDEPILSFLAPVGDREAGGSFGALLGRVYLEDSPALNQVLASLQWTRAEGEGLVVDENRRIVVHSDPDMILAELPADETKIPIKANVPGEAYETLNPLDNTRQLVYNLPVEGHPWSVVVRLPYQVVLEQAAKIATPLLVLQIVLGGGLVIIIPFVTGLLTRPLKQLASAADRIAEGDLAKPVQVTGDDEVVRVGDAFEGMRVRLKGRLDDLSLLLRVSQAVSATLELHKGVPVILEAALKATNAWVARMVLLSTEGDPQMVMARGEPRDGLGVLDRAFARAAQNLEQPLIVENLARATTLTTGETRNGPIKAVVALPVRTKDQMTAVMWVGYGEVRQFDTPEIDLLSTLAGQTAVLVENARLFQAAEGGRRRLAAILTSTNDAVLVTDHDDFVLLVNPAAERAFNIAADTVVGRKINGVDLAPALKQVFEKPLSDSEGLAEEVPLPDGRTLYASVSTILSADGERIGRVAVMRDITHFKELDELKSEFVATVSHDLRAPLTFMRGYATMLPMVGKLSDKQSEYVEKILQGVGQMSELIDDLLNLGRVEAGVGLERKPCHLGAILVEAVDGMRARASAKGVTLRLESAEGVAVISGDTALLRQAVSNLVDNAIKYTPSGGMVTVGLSMREGHTLIRVADTGIGIAPDDQVRLFEKFYRIKRRDTADIPGTGLGLAIVKSIVERHGGRVWVESELNQGSTFYISLPLDGADEIESLKASARR